MATPLLRALQVHFEDIVVLSAPHISEMLREDVGKLQLLNSENLKDRSGFKAEVGRLRELKPDIALIVNRSFRSALAAWLAGIKVRVGHATEGRSLFLNKRVHWDWERSEGESYGDLARAIGIDADYRLVHLSTTPAERDRGMELLDGATVAMQPGASFRDKSIPGPILAELIRRFASEGRKVALIGGKEEKIYADELKALVPEIAVVDLVGCCSIRESMGVAACLNLTFAGSTGIMHICTAVGCPTVSVFGPNRSAKWGHFYPPHQVLHAPFDWMPNLDIELVWQAGQRALNLAGMKF